MKHLFWLTLLLLTQATVPVKANNGTDSLRSVLKALPVEERLAKLNELASVRYDEGKGMYPKWLYKEVTELQNEKYLPNALFHLVRYYYGNKPDSMRYYLAKAEPLFLKEKRYEELFRMKAWDIYMLSSEGAQDAVLPAARELVELARQVGYPEGEEMANQALANYYLSHGLKKEGAELYEEVLDRMEKRNAPIIKRFNILRSLLNNSIPDEAHKRALERMKACLAECTEKDITMLDAEISIDYCWYVYYRTLASDACAGKKAKEAKEYLEKAEALVKKNKMSREELTIDNIRLYYYQMIGNNEGALAIIEKLLKNLKETKKAINTIDILEQKAKTLSRMGMGMKAAETYQELIELKDSVTTAKYYDELANWRTQHDVDKLELKNKQMALEASETHAQLLLMGGGLILLLLACGTLAVISYSRHKYSMQLKIAKEKAEEADRMKSAFLANMNHEIRTPLNAIVGFSQVLVDEEDADVRQEYQKIIQNNNELLQRLINDVLDLSKIESNSMTFSFFNIYLPEMMDEIYRATLLRMPAGVLLELKECFPINFYTDRMRLTQIITNLLNNAIKHTEKGFIRFGYDVLENEIKFFVEDTGEGIPEDKLESIFSRFVQLSDWSKGVGLGLAICKGLISNMGGKIAVTSKLGEGSVFYVTFPIHKKDGGMKISSR
ncbi:HAMP domain-containing sensor histidine kinase [uncultured Parabacteroides sp.]|uniref:sensor histidine kinase n=1 Tax=uncultured Parabacteroides sp. TaxID=512312 RepID=UPI002622D84E|nr:HAMP domain-containing sensor histidine kinase [uncultured Parabacteroides sp.]